MLRPLPGNALGNSTCDFSRKGFIGPIRLFTPEQCRAIAAELRREPRLKPADWSKGRAVTDRLWYDVGTRPSILSLLVPILGNNIILWGSALIKRSPGKVHHWHTDIESSSCDEGYASVWVGLENTCQRSALQFVTSSHLFGKSIQQVYHEHGFSRDDVTSDQVLEWAREFDQEAELIQPVMADGDALVFDGRMWHASHNTRTTGTRLALLLQYANANLPVRIPDLEHLEWPFQFLEEPLPQVIEVSGTSTNGINKAAQPPAQSTNADNLLFSATHSLPLPLSENNQKGWRPHHIFRGNTPILDFLSCHVSILSPAQSPHLPHSHKDEELLIVLDGEADLIISDTDDIEGAHIEKVRPGTLAYYRPYQHHTIRNSGQAPVTYLMFKWFVDGAKSQPSATGVFEYDLVPAKAKPRWTQHLFKMPTPYLGRLAAHVTVLQPGVGYEPHVDEYDVVILLLAGTVETISRRVSAPSVIYYQAGEPHGMSNVGHEPARYLVFEFHADKARPKKSAQERVDETRKPGSIRKEAQIDTKKLTKERDALVYQIDENKRAIESLERQRSAAQEDVEKLLRYTESLELRLNNVLRSRSWRIMRPYRFVGRSLSWLATGRWAPPNRLPRRPLLSLSDLGRVAPRPDKTERRVTKDKTERTVGGKAQNKTVAVKLEEKLWGGFSRYALEDLEKLKVSSTFSRRDPNYAAWALARWYASHGEHERALENLNFLKGLNPNSEFYFGSLLLKADCLTRLGQGETARNILNEAFVLKPGSATLCLAMANTFVTADANPEADDVRISWINRVYEKAGLFHLVKADPTSSLTFQNLATTFSKPAPSVEQSKVTVIVPAYNAESSLGVALRSLVAQTWQNLEIVLVDDCSTDNTFSIAEEFSRNDERVIAIRQTENLGAYAARNRALKVATGDYITVHDADDWSHPQKIELQVKHALELDTINCTNWARAREDLFFTGNLRKSRSLITPNASSVLFHRSVFEDQGGWDAVRVAGDTEFLRRLQRRRGEAGWPPPRALKDIPLSFALDNEDCLTRRKITSVKTLHHGIRREYHEAASHWHSTSNPNFLKIDIESDSRPFPVPMSILSSNNGSIDCDILFITDFNLIGGAYSSAVNYIDAAITSGMSSAIFQWRRYDLDVTRSLNHEVRSTAHEGKLQIVAPGEKIRASTVIVLYPVLLSHLVDLFPDLEFDKLIILVNQMATRLYSGGDVQYDPRVVRENVREVFGTEGNWVPISNLVRRLMDSDGRYPATHSETWTPLIDTATWCTQLPRWRGRTRKRPKVGRHGRDHYTKWPTVPAALTAAYCADKSCDVVLLGGAQHARDILGTTPKNWKIHAFGSVDPYTFLSDLDFFVHYPHEDYIEEFGRAPMEAMAIGIPVILPPVFRETFGEAALYAEPGDVWPTIESLWADEKAYLSRAKAGRHFVLANCGLQQLPGRLGRIAERR